MKQNSENAILRAVAVLRDGNRASAREILARGIQNGELQGDQCLSAVKLCNQIGEVLLAVEAAKQYAYNFPHRLDKNLYYWGQLARIGRGSEALEEIAKLPLKMKNDPQILHYCGTILSQQGAFFEAEQCFRQALSATAMLPQTWFALAMIKTFCLGDADLKRMQKIESHLGRDSTELSARFLYGLGKAYFDCKDYERAFDKYEKGAAIQNSVSNFDIQKNQLHTDRIIRQQTLLNLSELIPQKEYQSRAIFVNGLPRSGTTLVEQICVSHSKVVDGGEINAFRSATIPTLDWSLDGALRYQNTRPNDADPWASIALDYESLASQWFGDANMFVDKTLSQSKLMGLLLHTFPDAPIIWLRRNPEDTALSCYRTFFTSGVGWSWSLSDIGAYFREEDRLYRHWTKDFGDRILTVDYEKLVNEPVDQSIRILNRCNLGMEPQVFRPHRTKREVRTASVQQVRAPIHNARVGSADAVSAFMQPFREAYER